MMLPFARSRSQIQLLSVLNSFGAQRLASSRPRSDPQILGVQLSDALQDDPDHTATSVAGCLEPGSRQALLRALIPAANTTVKNLEDTYVDRLFRQADFKDGNGLLDRHVAATINYMLHIMVATPSQREC